MNIQKVLFFIIITSLSFVYQYSNGAGIFDYFFNKQSPPKSVLIGNYNAKQWPYPSASDSKHMKEYKQRVREIQSLYWNLDSNQVKLQKLTSALALCQLRY